MLGTRMALKGTMLTLFVNDPENSTNQRFLQLLVKDTFNLSLEMAEYFETANSEVRALPSEMAIERFYLYLVKKGLVEKPVNEVIYIGEYGRPSKEILKEYKYSVNPIESTMFHIRECMTNKSKAFINHQGYRIMVIDQSMSLSEVVIEVMHHELSLGTLHVGIVFDRTLDVTLNADDLVSIKVLIEELVGIKQFPIGISMGRVFVHLLPLIK
jgi:ACT domain-containing protein